MILRLYTASARVSPEAETVSTARNCHDTSVGDGDNYETLSS